jgi:ADP-heptose:LPS heptosyltransferase
MSPAPQKILVLHVAGLARTTLALPALRALRCGLPYAHITVAASDAAADIVRLAACADEVLPVGRLRGAQLLAPRASYHSLKTFGALRRGSFDLAIELERGAEAGLLLFAAKPAERLKAHASAGGKLKRLLEHVAEILPGGLAAPRHAAHRYLDALAFTRPRRSRASSPTARRTSGWRSGCERARRAANCSSACIRARGADGRAGRLSGSRTWRRG